jgi:hypothetical protein
LRQSFAGSRAKVHVLALFWNEVFHPSPRQWPAAVGLLAVPVFGESVLAKANRTPITPEQEQALIQGHRSWSKTSYSKRRSAMDRTMACVDAAESKHDLKTCRQQRKAARRALRKEHHAYMNQVREQAGLPIR